MNLFTAIQRILPMLNLWKILFIMYKGVIMSLPGTFKSLKKDGTVYQSGYNFRTKKSGVRPVICIKKDYITSLNG